MLCFNVPETSSLKVSTVHWKEKAYFLHDIWARFSIFFYVSLGWVFYFFIPSPRHPRGKKSPHVHDNRQLFWWTIKFLASEISQLIQMSIWPLKFCCCWDHRKYMTKTPFAKNWNTDFPLLWRWKSNFLTMTVFQVFTTISRKTKSFTQSKTNVYIHSGILEH